MQIARELIHELTLHTVVININFIKPWVNLYRGCIYVYTLVEHEYITFIMILLPSFVRFKLRIYEKNEKLET